MTEMSVWSESVLRACYCMKARRPLKAPGTGLTGWSLSGGTRISVARLRGAEKIQRIPESLRVHDGRQHDIAIPMIAAAQQPMTNDRHHPPEHTSPLPSLLRSPQSRSSMPFSNSSTAPPPPSIYSCTPDKEISRHTAKSGNPPSHHTTPQPSNFTMKQRAKHRCWWPRVWRLGKRTLYGERSRRDGRNFVRAKNFAVEQTP